MLRIFCQVFTPFWKKFILVPVFSCKIASYRLLKIICMNGPVSLWLINPPGSTSKYFFQFSKKKFTIPNPVMAIFRPWVIRDRSLSCPLRRFRIWRPHWRIFWSWRAGPGPFGLAWQLPGPSTATKSNSPTFNGNFLSGGSKKIWIWSESRSTKTLRPWPWYCRL